jgi:hypothetical protein
VASRLWKLAISFRPFIFEEPKFGREYAPQR